MTNKINPTPSKTKQKYNNHPSTYAAYTGPRAALDAVGIGGGARVLVEAPVAAPLARVLLGGGAFAEAQALAAVPAHHGTAVEGDGRAVVVLDRVVALPRDRDAFPLDAAARLRFMVCVLREDRDTNGQRCQHGSISIRDSSL